MVVAAGRGLRAAGDKPKQYWDLGGKPALRWALEAFAARSDLAGIQAVIGEDDRELFHAATRTLALREPVIGGATRQESVRNGLEALAAAKPDHVLIHDGARPFVSAAMIERVLAALGDSEAVIPLLPVTDTLRRATDRGYEIVPRENLRRAQTPQGFKFEAILAAHRAHAGMEAGDDAQLAEASGMKLTAVEGEEINLKLTTAEDFLFAERIATSAQTDIRTGTGFDIHKFVPGDHVWLCGIKIPHEFALEGHSDADAGLHAATDAILGALGAGDIGMHFPPSDAKWRHASSHLFLSHAAELVAREGGAVSHLDITLICETPKIAPYREDMRKRVAEILGVAVERVSVKATTTEGLGALGRREGIAAQAVATIRLPWRVR